MSDQWEKYVEDPARLLDPDAFDRLDPHHAHWAMKHRREIALKRVRQVLEHAGPLIAEDTRVRLVAAAARAVEREQADDESAVAVHKPFPDDGVTYCGWSTGKEIIDGCGEVYPCSTIRNHRNPNRKDDLP